MQRSIFCKTSEKCVLPNTIEGVETERWFPFCRVVGTEATAECACSVWYLRPAGLEKKIHTIKTKTSITEAVAFKAPNERGLKKTGEDKKGVSSDNRKAGKGWIALRCPAHRQQPPPFLPQPPGEGLPRPWGPVPLSPHPSGPLPPLQVLPSRWSSWQPRQVLALLKS